MSSSREINRLRKSGKLGEALELARQQFQQFPEDIWLIRAYGWTLRDCLKKSEKENDLDRMKSFLEEFDMLQIPEGPDDEPLKRARENWREKVFAEGDSKTLGNLLRQGKQASNSGNRSEAISIYREAVKCFPDSEQASNRLAWELHRQLKDILASEDFDGEDVRGLLKEYSRLRSIKKPSNLHSLMLHWAAKAAVKGKLPTFFDFLYWWDITYIQKSDFERYTAPDSGIQFDSRIESVIKAISKVADKEQNEEKIRFAAEFVESHYRKFPEQEWFPYYLAKLLIRLNDLNKARKLIIPVVQRKSSQAWAWQKFASTFESIDSEKQLSCLCRAVLCKGQDEDRMVTVHEDLAKLLCKTNHFPEAKYEIEKVVQIRKQRDWKIPQPIQDMKSMPWFENTASVTDMSEFYKQHAKLADDLLFSELPVVTCNGIIKSINELKKVSYIALNKDEVIKIHHAKLSQVKALEAGTIIKLNCRLDEERNIFYPISFEISDEDLPSSFYREYSGEISIQPHNRFGFADDVYIPGDLIERYRLEDNELIKGQAIMELDKKKQKYSWRAISVQKED